LPKVPTVAPTVGPTVFQNIQASPDAFGAAQGRGQVATGQQLQQFGGQLIDEAARRQVLDNDREIKLAVIEHKKQLLAIKNEFDQLKGEAAVDAEPEFQSRLAGLQGEISSSLSNSKAVDDFMLNSALDQINFADNLSRTATVQREFAQTTASATLVQEENNVIIANFFDDDQVATSIARIGVEARAEMERLGGSEDDIELAGEQSESNAVRGSIIAALAARNTSRAQEIFSGEFGRLLKGKDRIDVDKMISSAIDLEFAQEQADVVAALSQNPDGTIDFEKAINLLRETPGLKGKQLQDSITELSKRVAETNAFKEQRLGDAESDLDQTLNQ